MADLKTELATLKIDPALRQSTGSRAGWAAVLVLVLLVAAGAAWWWTTEPRPIVQVAAAEAAPSEAMAGAVLNASGYVTARRRATVSSKMTGKVVAINVEEGMHVREGQVLARLDDSQLRASHALAEAQIDAARRAVDESEVRLKEAELTLRRREQLLREGIVGQADVDAAQAEADSLRARIASARQQIEVQTRQLAVIKAQLDDTIIRAPFSGVAISKDAQPGEMVSPVSAGGGFTRTGISTIVDMTSLEIEVDVNESYINRVTPGQKATAVLDAYPDWQIPAYVITTIPSADRQKATVLVRLGFGEAPGPSARPRPRVYDPRILPDMGVKVAFHGDREPAAAASARASTQVPRTAVRTDGNARIVFVVDADGRVERRAVTLGAEQGDRVAVLSGLNAGERVVVAPPAELRDGMSVRIETRE